MLCLFGYNTGACFYTLLEAVLVLDEGGGLGPRKNRFNPQSWFPRPGILSPYHPEYTVQHYSLYMNSYIHEHTMYAFYVVFVDVYACELGLDEHTIA